MTYIDKTEPISAAVTQAIQAGDTTALQKLLIDNPGLSKTKIKDGEQARSLLHIATDWPGHFPKVPDTIGILVNAGADINARFEGHHRETPLHWAASSNDVEALDALLDAGADIEADGAVIAGGTPLADARGFAQWNAARRLVERGAHTSLIDAATLGLVERVEMYLNDNEKPGADEINFAFWGACRGGHRDTATLLLNKEADINYIPYWARQTPLDAARQEGHWPLSDWLVSLGARTVS